MRFPFLPYFEHGTNTSFPLPPSELVTTITATILTGICKCYFLAYLSDVAQEAEGRSQGPWAQLLVIGYVSFLVVRAIIFPVSDFLTF